ncbi:MAG: M28 family peptidase, partial [Gemmatimonadetes bacterium]|nr:M28 family peptidase [Gemmatimonadota bacterium]
MKRRVFSLSAALVLLLSAPGLCAAQEREDRTLLGMDAMRAIINEASGERAMHHIMEFVPYVRVRPIEEYKAHFRESEAMVNFAKQYGYSSAEIESYPTTGVQFQATQAELWMVEPEVRKLFDIYDVPLALAGSAPQGEVTAELIDIGMGQPQNINGMDFKGKFVLVGQGGTRQGVQGNVGFIGYNNLRPDDQPDMIGQGGGGGGGGGAQLTNWQVSPRVGRELAGILARGQKVVLKSVIKGETVPGEIELVHMTIAGDGSSRQSIAISCHLHEGYIKQGANDDASGCALTLEAGRAYLALVNQGKLPKPKRTLHFLGVPEISGTNAYLNAHPEIASTMVADLNYDMDGLRLATNGSFWVVHRTPDTFPSYLNDVAQSFVE